MELHEAQANIEFWSADIRRNGLAATPPRPEEFMMTVILVLEDMLETVKRLDDWYMNFPLR